MTRPSPTHPTPAGARVRPPREGRSNGQWLVDGRAPLNANEEFKAADDGLAVRARIESTYAREGFASIPSDDLHGRMRWWGLYTQRRPGIDGGRTGTLGPDELSDEYFMMRVRLDGGAVNVEQLRTIAGISTDFGRDTADISDRQNVQFHWIRIEDVPEIWRRLEAVGLRTIEACGDTPRVVLGSPVAGVAADEIIDPTPLINEIVERWIGDPELSNLPRKFKTAVTGHPNLDVVHEINDISFVGVVHPELGAGYDLWIGGGLATAPRLAERLGAFVTPEQAPRVWHGVASIFRDYGYRRLRNKARLKFLLAEWGPQRFRQVLQDDYLGHALADGPAAVASGGPADHVGVHRQADGNYYIGFAPKVGRMSGTRLAALADAVAAVGSDRIRFTPHQKVLVLDVPPRRAQGLRNRLARIGLTDRPGPFRRHTMACTGIEFCKLAFVDTKNTAAAAIDVLDSRLADLELDVPISLHVNGCPNSCVRVQTADIGLKGQLAKAPDGSDEFAFQVHLGGGLASADRAEPGFGRTLRGLKVTADEMPAYVERVVRRFAADRDAGETFAHWAHRADEEALR